MLHEHVQLALVPSGHPALATLLVATAASLPSDAVAAEVLQTKTGAVNVERLAALSEPWGMTFLPDGRLLVTEKPGRLRIYCRRQALGADRRRAEGGLSRPGRPARRRGRSRFRAQRARLSLFRGGGRNAARRTRRDVRAIQRFGTNFDKEDNVLKGGAVARGRLDGNAARATSRSSGGRCRRRSDAVTSAAGSPSRPTASCSSPPAIGSASTPRRTSRPTSARSCASTPTARSPKTTRSSARQARGPTSGRSAIATRSARRSIPRSKQLWIHEMGPRHGDELNVPEPGKNYGWPIVSNGDNYDGSANPRPSDAARVRRAAHLLAPRDLAVGAHLLHGQPLRRLARQCARRRPVLRDAGAAHARRQHGEGRRAHRRCTAASVTWSRRRTARCCC